MNKKFWQDRSVLVTGATGFLGGWLVKKLAELNANVVCTLRDVAPQSQFYTEYYHTRVSTVSCDITDFITLDRVMNEYGVATVLHTAAQTQVKFANTNPLPTFKSNIEGTWNVLEASRNNGVAQVVIASSDKAYGECSAFNYTEEMPLAGSHPYDVSKSCTDLIAQSYAKTYDLPVVITRCGNFFGGGDLNWKRIVPSTIRSIIRNDTPIIHSDGKMVRDYFYIEDGVNAYLELAEKLYDNPNLKGEAFNFSSNNPRSVIGIVSDIIREMNVDDCSPVILGQATNEIKYQSLNSDKARNMLNWKPEFEYKEALIRTINWYKDYFGK
jgi:CDP-glucose 4,6-dehydratase